MLKRLLAVLLLVPLLDGLFLIFVAGQLGWQLTVALVVLTALVGMLFVRAEGRHTLRKLERSVAEGKPPTNELLDGAFLLVAGAFLLTPGLVTDTLGFLFIIPPTRYVFRTVVKKWLVTPYLERKTGGFVSGNVYTFGFPNASESGSADSGDVYDVGSDAYNIDIEDEDGTDERR